MPLDHRRRRAARGLGLVQGARAPAPDLPRRRRGRATSRPAARTSRRSRSRCGRQFAAGDRRGRHRQRAGPHRRDDVGVRHHRARPSRRRRAGHEVRVFPALVDEGATVGLQVFGSADEQEARHRLGVRRLLLLELASPVKAIARRPDQRREARPGRVAVPERRRAARGLPGRRRRRPSSTPARRCATEAAYDALLAEAGARPRGAAAGDDGRRDPGARRLAAGREGAQRARRHGACCPR